MCIVIYIIKVYNTNKEKCTEYTGSKCKNFFVVLNYAIMKINIR